MLWKLDPWAWEEVPRWTPASRKWNPLAQSPSCPITLRTAVCRLENTHLSSHHAHTLSERTARAAWHCRLPTTSFSLQKPRDNTNNEDEAAAYSPRQVPERRSNPPVPMSTNAATFWTSWRNAHEKPTRPCLGQKALFHDPSPSAHSIPASGRVIPSKTCGSSRNKPRCEMTPRTKAELVTGEQAGWRQRTLLR
jgi:hypothetical protein